MCICIVCNVTWDCNETLIVNSGHSLTGNMEDENVLWRRELCFFLYVISPCLNFSPQFLQLENRAKDLNCTNITDEMAPGRPDPLTFSWQSDKETRAALQRSRMNWPGIRSTDFRACFLNRELDWDQEEGMWKRQEYISFFTSCWFPPLPPSLPLTPQHFLIN